MKAALVESYVGAILIALLASRGLTNIIQPIFTMIGQAVANAKSGEPTRYGPEVAIFVIAHAFVYFLIAFLLLRWLYFPAELVLPQETEEPNPES